MINYLGIWGGLAGRAFCVRESGPHLQVILEPLCWLFGYFKLLFWENLVPTCRNLVFEPTYWMSWIFGNNNNNNNNNKQTNRTVDVEDGGVLVPGVRISHQLGSNAAPLLLLLWMFIYIWIFSYLLSVSLWIQSLIIFTVASFTDINIITFPLNMYEKWSVLFEHPKHRRPAGSTLEPQNQWPFNGDICDDSNNNDYDNDICIKMKMTPEAGLFCLGTNQKKSCESCSWSGSTLKNPL